MQNARDTFYVTLRDRLAAVNPARTMLVRGVVRPGLLVEENELASANAPADVFRLRWTGLRVDAEGALPLVVMGCEIRYATDGSAGNGGMDRGRLLAAMSGELGSCGECATAERGEDELCGFAGGGDGNECVVGGCVVWGCDGEWRAAGAGGER